MLLLVFLETCVIDNLTLAFKIQDAAGSHAWIPLPAYISRRRTNMQSVPTGIQL